MFQGCMKYSTQGLKHSTEVSNIQRRGLIIPRRYEILHGAVKYSTEVSNIPRRCLSIPRRCQIFHGGG